MIRTSLGVVGPFTVWRSRRVGKVRFRRAAVDRFRNQAEWHAMSRTVAVTNQKGGVAKTTTVASVGVALADLGQRVLLVDLDPQACLTFSLGFDPEDVGTSVYQLILGEVEPGAAVVSCEEGPDLVPSTIELATAELTLLTRARREQALRLALEPVRSSYDWVLLDCPPTLGLLTVSALSAATDVLIPLQCETLSHRGVGQLLDTIHDVKQYTNRGLNVLGVLPTLYDGRTNHARAVLEAIPETYGVAVFAPPIPKSIRFAEAPAVGRSVLSTATRSRGADAYRNVATALLRS
jgi:chromosome partitioning protein